MGPEPCRSHGRGERGGEWAGLEPAYGPWRDNLPASAHRTGGQGVRKGVFPVLPLDDHSHNLRVWRGGTQTRGPLIQVTVRWWPETGQEDTRRRPSGKSINQLRYRLSYPPQIYPNAG